MKEKKDAKVKVSRSKHQDGWQQTINIRVDGKLRVRVFWVNGSPYLDWEKV